MYYYYSMACSAKTTLLIYWSHLKKEKKKWVEMNFENEFFLLFNYIFTKYLLSFNTEFGKGQYISKQNC